MNKILIDYYNKLKESKTLIECLGVTLSEKSSKEELLGALKFAFDMSQKQQIESMENMRFMKDMVDLK
jgi:hypothetical protein